MLLRDMNKKQSDLGIFKRQDGENFAITAVFYETPTQYDYWLVVFDAEHADWGHMRFQAIIPKKIASTIAHAEALASSEILMQVKASLTESSASGRNLAPVFAFDGWTLI